MIEPTYSEPLGQLFLGDALQILPQLPEASVDLCLTDPPFFIRQVVIIHRSMNPIKYKARSDIVSGEWEWDAQWQSEEDYLAWTEKWFREVARVLRYGGHFVCAFDRLRVGFLHSLCQELGFITRQPLHVIETNPVPCARQIGFMRAVLHLFWCTRGTTSRRYATFNWQLGMSRDYIEVPICGGKERLRDLRGWTVHPTQKPEALAEWIIKYLSNEGDLVLDPFMGCYDEETEVLTEKGFKKFASLTYEDNIATLDRNHNLEFQKPIEIFCFNYRGPMYRFKGEHVDLKVTPNHRMFVLDRYSKNYTFKLPKDVLTGDELKRDAKWQGAEVQYFTLPPITDQVRGRNWKKHQIPIQIPMDDWLAFFGLWLADGSVDKSTKRIKITQLKHREKVQEILQRLPFGYRILNNGKDFAIYNKQLHVYLKQFGKKEERFIPPEFKLLSARQLNILLDSLVLGDGYQDSKGRRRIWTSSPKLADDIQEILLKIGSAGQITRQPPRKGNLSIGDRRIIARKPIFGIYESRTHLTPKINKRWISLEDYAGLVYCCSVPNATLYVRRNGKAVWCGNSGTFPAVAKRLNRRFIGIEINPKYFEYAKARLAATGTQLQLNLLPPPEEPTIDEYPRSFQGWLDFLKNAKNDSECIGYLGDMIRLLGEQEPDFAKLGRLYNRVGKDAGYLAKLIWLAVAARPAGDLVDYITAIVKRQRKSDEDKPTTCLISEWAAKKWGIEPGAYTFEELNAILRGNKDKPE